MNRERQSKECHMDYLKIENVVKVARKKNILEQISLTVEKGEIFGLIGPNGAGKTTLMKILCGLYSFSEGKITLDDKIFGDKIVNTNGRVGAIIENPTFYNNLSGYDNLKIMTSGKAKKNQMEDIIEMIDIGSYINQKVSKYSLGMKQRLGIALALVNEPDLLILDEAINGLDIEGVAQVRNLIKKLAEKKKITILISSHILSEMDKICDRAAFIKNGKILSVVSKKNLSDNSLETEYLKMMEKENV